MVQWINALQNNSYVNLSRLPLLSKKTGAIALVQLGLMAGGQRNATTFRDFILDETF